MERPGYFGRHREARHLEYDVQFGVGGWRLAWKVRELEVELPAALMLYEDAYYFHLVVHPELLEQLVTVAREVYDDDPMNVESGLDYSGQQTVRNHFQDIAIRRCLVRRGLWFEGERLIQIRDDRGEHELSRLLSPGRVPFHRPEWILQPELEGWWRPESIESFYQSNKLLQRLVLPGAPKCGRPLSRFSGPKVI